MKELDEDVFAVHRIYAAKVLKLKPSQQAVITNGRMIGPLEEGEVLSINDFELLEKLTMSQYGDKLVQARVYKVP